VATLDGPAPINHDSGKYAGKRRAKGGRTWLRPLLYQAALVASITTQHLNFFEKTSLLGKKRQVLIRVFFKNLIGYLINTI